MSLRWCARLCQRLTMFYSNTGVAIGVRKCNAAASCSSRRCNPSTRSTCQCAVLQWRVREQAAAVSLPSAGCAAQHSPSVARRPPLPPRPQVDPPAPKILNLTRCLPWPKTKYQCRNAIAPLCRAAHLTQPALDAAAARPPSAASAAKRGHAPPPPPAVRVLLPTAHLHERKCVIEATIAVTVTIPQIPHRPIALPCHAQRRAAGQVFLLCPVLLRLVDDRAACAKTPLRSRVTRACRLLA